MVVVLVLDCCIAGFGDVSTTGCYGASVVRIGGPSM